MSENLTDEEKMQLMADLSEMNSQEIQSMMKRANSEQPESVKKQVETTEQPQPEEEQKEEMKEASDDQPKEETITTQKEEEPPKQNVLKTLQSMTSFTKSSNLDGEVVDIIKPEKKTDSHAKKISIDVKVNPDQDVQYEFYYN